jgi:pimeloyl-ACP methyl ester carboxylesterase
MRLQHLAASVLLFLAFVCPAQTKPSLAGPHPLGKLIDVGGYRVHLYCIGNGSPTVVITGAGYSFDWGLVQPEVGKHTRVCAYDHSGIAWSDLGPPDSCSVRVSELHEALQKASVPGPFVMVGHSLGALVSRLYASKYPKDVAGLVFVDHASHNTHTYSVLTSLPPPLFGNPVGTNGPSSVPSSSARTEAPPEPASGSGLQDLEWQKLPPADYELHQWADSRPNHQTTMAKNNELVSECSSDVESATQNLTAPLGNRPLIVLHVTGSAAAAVQLALLSTNSKEIDVQNSSHFIMVDRPEVVISAILRVVEAVRENQNLTN